MLALGIKAREAIGCASLFLGCEFVKIVWVLIWLWKLYQEFENPPWAFDRTGRAEVQH